MMAGQMLQIKPIGPGSAALKYDIITALGAHALALGKVEQRLVLRFITLITARYNWGQNDLCVGQREIARMWACTERTVKREMAKLRGMGWLVVKRQGARGRVTQYGIDTEAMLFATKSTWAAVGPDFAIRMEGAPEQTSVVPLPIRGKVTPPDISDGTEWALAQAILFQEDPASFGSWINALKRSERVGGRLTLAAPSRFHAAYVQSNLSLRILNACQAVDADISAVAITDA